MRSSTTVGTNNILRTPQKNGFPYFADVFHSSQIAGAIGVLTSSTGDCARFWRLGAGATAGYHCQMCGRVCFGAWVLIPLQRAAAGCWCSQCASLVPLQGTTARCVAVCALELACWCQCKVPLRGAAAGLRQFNGSARFGVWVQVSCCPQRLFAISHPDFHVAPRMPRTRRTLTLGLQCPLELSRLS